MDLTNASAIVTGGAGGFGSATVRRLAQKGAKVVIADVSDERGEARPRARADAGPRRGSTPPGEVRTVINVYLNSAFAVTSQAAEEMAKNEPLASNQRSSPSPSRRS
jgi:nucleoside-diphosphate-sugar epimerase